MVRHAAMVSSRRTAHAVQANVLVAAIVSGPEARFTPRAASTSTPERTFRTLKRPALSLGFIDVDE